jgi:hypothetical protein
MWNDASKNTGCWEGVRQSRLKNMLLQYVLQLHHDFKSDAEIGHVPTIQVTGTNRSYLFIMFFFKQWLLKYYVYDAVLIIGRLKVKSSSVPQFLRPKGIKRCTACVGLEARHPRLHVTFGPSQNYFFFPMAQQPLVSKGLLITEASRSHSRLITFNRTPLDEWAAPRRDRYMTTHNTNKRETFTPPAEFEPAIPGSERLQTHALDSAAIWIGKTLKHSIKSIHNRWKNSKSPGKIKLILKNTTDCK